jgi:hypothetical protein
MNSKNTSNPGSSIEEHHSKDHFGTSVNVSNLKVLIQAKSVHSSLLDHKSSFVLLLFGTGFTPTTLTSLLPLGGGFTWKATTEESSDAALSLFVTGVESS